MAVISFLLTMAVGPLNLKTPGDVVTYVLFHGNGPADIGLVLAVFIITDTIVCFGLIFGLFSLGSRIWRKWKSDFSNDMPVDCEIGDVEFNPRVHEAARDVMRRRISFLKIVRIGIAALLSIPIAFCIDKAMGFVTPGSLVFVYLFPDAGDLPDAGGPVFMRNLLVEISVDSALCFGMILGLYYLSSKLVAKIRK